MQDELQRTKLQLAELIDEVVFAETQTSTCEKEKAALSKQLCSMEDCLQDFVAYATSIENAVLIPALKELTHAIPDESLSHRAQAIAKLDALQNLSARTAKLILSLKSPSAATIERFQKRREDILRTHHADSEGSVDLEQAYLLVAFLLEAKDELRILINDSVEQVGRLRGAPANPSLAAGALELERTQERCRSMEKETTALKQMVAALQKDRDVLMSKVDQAAPLKALQEQYHSEREGLQQKLKASEAEVRRLNDEWSASRASLAATQRALDQAMHEKVLLDDDHQRSSQSNHFGDNRQSSTTSIANANGGGLKFWEAQSHRLQLDLEDAERNHSTIVTRLEGQISQLRMRLSESGAHSHDASQHQRDQIQQLRKANESMHHELQLLQQQFLSTSPRPQHYPSMPDAQPASPAMESKIQAFEATIHALQTELLRVEGKVKAVEHHYTRERDQLVADHDAERRRYQIEREDCDALVLRMGTEMEQLVKENDTLRTLLSSNSLH